MHPFKFRYALARPIKDLRTSIAALIFISMIQFIMLLSDYPNPPMLIFFQNISPTHFIPSLLTTTPARIRHTPSRIQYSSLIEDAIT